MKKFAAPELQELNISATAQGKNMNTEWDEVRVDQNGKYWVSFGSGKDSNPDIDGEVIAK